MKGNECTTKFLWGWLQLEIEDEKPCYRYQLSAELVATIESYLLARLRSEASQTTAAADVVPETTVEKGGER